ncbi:MAG: GldG family protein [Deltaproteobacteria bacterium]|nr:GldG family protein [Deltaproteobacteria bacterium]
MRFKDIELRSLFPRSIRYGANVFLLTIFLLGILVIINALSARHNIRFDLTKTKRYTLSPQSVKVLQGLKEEVKAIAFYREGEAARKGAEDLLEQYAYLSKRFKYKFIDPDRHPGKAKKYEITSYGIVVVECGGKEEKVFDLTEESFTNAIIRATREGRKIIYFLQGHGEHALDDVQRSGYSLVKRTIEDQNYKVKTLLLLREKGVPQDAAVLVIGGPQKDLLPLEIEDIKKYVERGGKLLIMADPYSGQNLRRFLDGYGLHLVDDVIIDKLSRVLSGDYLTPVVSLYENHPITGNFRDASFFPVAQSITIDREPPGGIEVASLAKTGPQSWGELDRERLEKGEATFEEGRDKEGPLIVAAVSTKRVEAKGGKGKKARIVLFGDSDFITNTYFGISGNGDLFLNAVSWLAEEEDLIAIRPKPPNITPIILSPSQVRWVFWLAVVILPGAVILAGVFILARRRWRR